jgi:hypothetical protein
MKTLIVRPDLIFVGQEHGKQVTVPPKIKAATEQYGAWYEGNGDDKIPEIKYKGSWDDAAAKDVKGYPVEFLFVIFTNSAVNEQKDIFVGNDSIFNQILKTQNKFGYFKDRKFDAQTLTKFLQNMGGDFLKMSQMTATKANVGRFVDKGEREMWESGQTETKKMADKANKYRDLWLLKQPKGVYFLGSDHLKDIESALKNKSASMEKTNPQQKTTKLI